MKVPKAIQDVIESFERLPGVGPKFLRSNWHISNRPLQKCEAGHDNWFLMTTTSDIPGSPNTHPVCHRASYNAKSSDFNRTYANRWEIFPETMFANELPTMWPTVSIRVRTAYAWMDFHHQARIEQTDPYTGTSTVIVVHGMTTTLRGARRQRGLDRELPDPNYD